MVFFDNNSHLTEHAMRTLLYYCAAAALLILFAVNFSSAPPQGASLAAATALGNAQGVPPNRTGMTYPDNTTCYYNASAGSYGNGPFKPLCGSGNWGGRDITIDTDTFFSEIFSINGVATPAAGESLYAQSTHYNSGYEQGPDMGPAVDPPACPSGYRVFNQTCYLCPSGYKTLKTTNSGTVECKAGGNNVAPALGQTPLSNCPYPAPAGYDSVGTSPSGGWSDTSSFGSSPTECYAWKHVPEHVTSALSSAGSEPVVAPGGSLTVAWSCLKERKVYREYHASTGGNCVFGCAGNWSTSEVYGIGVASGASGSGPGFAPSGLFGSQTVAVPPDAPLGTVYTYSLSCDGKWNLLPMSINVTVGNIKEPTINITADKTNIAVGERAIITATFAAGTGDTLLKTAIDGPNSTNLAPGLSTAPQTATQSTTTYTFVPTAAGSYTFIPDMWTQNLKSWNHSGGASVTITASSTCQNGQGTAGNCTSCNSGFVKQGGNCTAQCQNGQGPAGGCTSCNGGFKLQGTSCVASANSCANGLDYAVYGPACACPQGQHQSGPSCVPDSGQILQELKANPSRVRKGESTSLTWSTQGMQSCTLAQNGTIIKQSAPLSSNNYPSPLVALQSTFTLSCKDNNGKPFASSATVTVLPSYIEI